MLITSSYSDLFNNHTLFNKLPLFRNSSCHDLVSLNVKETSISPKPFDEAKKRTISFNDGKELKNHQLFAVIRRMSCSELSSFEQEPLLLMKKKAMSIDGNASNQKISPQQMKHSENVMIKDLEYPNKQAAEIKANQEFLEVDFGDEEEFECPLCVAQRTRQVRTIEGLDFIKKNKTKKGTLKTIKELIKGIFLRSTTKIQKDIKKDANIVSA